MSLVQTAAVFKIFSDLSRLSVSLWVFAGLLCARGVEAQADVGDRARLAGQVRAGVEYDDNALRASGAEGQADLIARYFASLDGLYGLDASSAVSLQVRHGGKRYMQLDRADTMLTQLGVGYQRRLGDSVTLGVNADIKDRTERVSFLDYHTGGLGLSLGWQVGWFGLDAMAGWRYFAFKPNNATGNDGPTASVVLRAPLTQSWQLNLSYAWFSRRFDVRQLVAIPDEPGRYAQSEQTRQDYFQVLRFGGSWRGPIIVDGGYAVSWNRSNSAGQDLMRHSVELTLTAPLVWGWLGSAHAELLRTSYDDPFLIDANFLIDEDNRNTAVFALSRPFGDRWDVELRYSLFTQEFGGARDYTRQTLMLALGCLLD